MNRNYQPSLEVAFRAFPNWPEANLSRIREIVEPLTIEKFYIPPAGGYIGLEIAGQSSVVCIAYGYVTGLRNKNDQKYWVELPINQIRDGGESRSPDSIPLICKFCSMELPATGVCDDHG